MILLEPDLQPGILDHPIADMVRCLILKSVGHVSAEKPGLKLKHEAGTVSMANSGKNSNRCLQF